MNINKSVKRNKIVVTILVSVAALLLCVLTSKAYAAPSEAELTETLDKCSVDYYEAMAARDTAQAAYDEANSRVTYCNSKIPELQGKLGERAKSLYVNGTGSIIELLTGATSIQDLINNIQLLTIMSNKDTAMIRECQQLREELSQQLAALESNLAEAQAQANAASDALSKAQAAIDDAHNQGYEPGGGGGGGHIDPTTGNAIADRALGEQGKPYGTAGVGPDYYDCSGLVSYAVLGRHQRLGSTETFMGYPRLSSPEIGCICTHWTHCGIYVADGTMCHSPTYGQTVCCTGVQAGMIYVVAP